MEAAGGKLLNAGGELRVMGMLACTRSIGDHDLQEFGVTAEPEVIQITRSEQDQYLIIASDGLWDKFSNQVGAAPTREAGLGLCLCGGCVLVLSAVDGSSHVPPCCLPTINHAPLCKHSHLVCKH